LAESGGHRPKASSTTGENGAINNYEDAYPTYDSGSDKTAKPDGREQQERSVVDGQAGSSPGGEAATNEGGEQTEDEDVVDAGESPAAKRRFVYVTKRPRITNKQ
jgi:hypothetical protein